MWGDSTITIVGRTLLAQWAAGGTLTITKAALGSGTVEATQLTNLTAVTDRVTDASIINFKKSDNNVIYTVRVTAFTSAYTCKQVGIFAKLDDGDETLIAIYQDDDGFAVPSASDVPEFVYDFFATIAMDASSSLSVTISSDVYTLQNDFDAHTEDSDVHVTAEKQTNWNNNITKLSSHTSNGTIHVTSSQKTTWNAKQDAIDDLDTIRSGAALGATALQEVPATYRTAEQQDAIHDSTKQDVISDLETIRSGAGKGATALQSVPNTYRTAAEQDAIHDSTKADKTALETEISERKAADESLAEKVDKQLLEMETALKSGLETDAAWHLGFYLDENGDLCQVESEEE